MDFLSLQLNFNSVENVPGYEARAAFTVNPATVVREDVDNFVLFNISPA